MNEFNPKQMTRLVPRLDLPERPYLPHRRTDRRLHAQDKNAIPDALVSLGAGGMEAEPPAHLAVSAPRVLVQVPKEIYLVSKETYLASKETYLGRL